MSIACSLSNIAICVLALGASPNKELAHKLAILAKRSSSDSEDTAIIAEIPSPYRERVSIVRYPGYHCASVHGTQPVGHRQDSGESNTPFR